ncbi:CHAP domain-containing protein [Tyzzerella sp. OttesenSCG-928-J15]|nr:CHAP domain-containing protein [Tyzzerella sp. OttesenSCG-928-J15]
MLKRIMPIALAAAILIQSTPVFAHNFHATARQNDAEILLNGETTTVKAYNIDGYNYFRLRDICKPLNFHVDWDMNHHAVLVDTAKPYVGEGETFTPSMTVINLEVVDTTVLANGVDKQISSCNIDGYNYFKLRDIADLIDESAQIPENSDKYSISLAWDSNHHHTVINTLNPRGNNSQGANNQTAHSNSHHSEWQMPSADLKPMDSSQQTAQQDSVNTANQNQTSTERTRQPQLTQAPKVGSQLAKILVDDSVSPYNADGTTNRDNFFGAYWVGNIGQCTWYAMARFYEATAIDNYTYGKLFTSVGKSAGIPLTQWLDNADREDLPSVYSIRNSKDIVAHSIAVWDGPNASGHVVFIEYVEYDTDGNPTEVYFSEGNMNATQTYKLGVDGTIQVLSFDKFVNRGINSGHIFKGYIAAR